LYPLNFGLVQLGGQVAMTGQKVMHCHHSLYCDEDVDMIWAETGAGVVTSEEDFEKYSWPDPEQTVLSILDQAQPLHPHGKRVVANIGKI